jgi:hypothetical protein
MINMSAKAQLSLTLGFGSRFQASRRAGTALLAAGPIARKQAAECNRLSAGGTTRRTKWLVNQFCFNRVKSSSVVGLYFNFATSSGTALDGIRSNAPSAA